MTKHKIQKKWLWWWWFVLMKTNLLTPLTPAFYCNQIIAKERDKRHWKKRRNSIYHTTKVTKAKTSNSTHPSIHPANQVSIHPSIRPLIVTQKAKLKFLWWLTKKNRPFMYENIHTYIWWTCCLLRFRRSLMTLLSTSTFGETPIGSFGGMLKFVKRRRRIFDILIAICYFWRACVLCHTEIVFYHHWTVMSQRRTDRLPDKSVSQSF